MAYILNKTDIYGKKPHFILKSGKSLLANKTANSFCIKILYIDTRQISFTDNCGNFQTIYAEYLPLWGYDIYAEVLCDIYNSRGLNVNTSRCIDYYKEAKSYLNENDYICFCNYNRNRWKEIMI